MTTDQFKYPLFGHPLITPRRVYFSFHYQRDVQRMNVVKNHWITKGTNTAAGYFNGSLEEEAKTRVQTHNHHMTAAAR